MSSNGKNKREKDQQETPRPSGAPLGSIVGRQTDSGRFSGLEFKAVGEDEAPMRQRLYSEEDEELRQAKAMALAIQQNPNMTPEEIHRMHYGDELQSQLIEKEHHASTSQHSATNIRQSIAVFSDKIQGVVQDTTAAFTKEGPSNIASNMKTTAAKQASASKDGASAAAHKVTTAAKQAAATVVSATPTNSAATSSASSKPPAPSKKDSKLVTIKEKPPAKKESTVSSSRSTTPPTVPTTSTSAPVTPTEQEDDEKTKKKKEKLLVTLGLAEKPLVPDQDAQIRLSAVVWKRRSGFGKLSVTKAWERRKMILQGSRIFYFSEKEEKKQSDSTSSTSSWFDSSNWISSTDDPTTPRGYLDLVKERATVAASTGHSGAPTPFAISIKVSSDTYWKFCFDSHKTQMEWLAALTDLVVTASVDAYNANLLASVDPSQEPALTFGGTYMEPPKTDGHKEHRLWTTQSYSVSSKDLVEAAAEEKVEPIVTPEPAVEEEEEEEEDVERWILHDRQVYIVVAILNVGLVCCRLSTTTTQGFWYILTFANIGLWLCLAREHKIKTPPPASQVLPGQVSSRQVVPEELKEEQVSGYKPIAGTTSVKIKEITDPPEVNGQMFGGWRCPSGEMLAVRSHGYLTSKIKVPSPGELYECVNCDIFESPHRYPDMAPRVELPKVEFENEDGGTKTWRAPDIFVVSVSLPTDPPKMRGGSSEDGGGYTVTMYFAMKQDTRDILRRVTADDYDPLKEPEPQDKQKSKVNAVKLFEAWCRRAPTDPAFQSRFKLVATSQNLKEIGIPSWIGKYNGKPVLIKRPGQTGFLYSHPELSCMEFDISFFPFPYVAKTGICYLKENFFKKVVVTFGFVIEGRADEELPECIIGLMQLCYPDPQYAIQGADFFSGKSPKSF